MPHFAYLGFRPFFLLLFCHFSSFPTISSFSGILFLSPPLAVVTVPPAWQQSLFQSSSGSSVPYLSENSLSIGHSLLLLIACFGSDKQKGSICTAPERRNCIHARKPSSQAIQSKFKQKVSSRRMGATGQPEMSSSPSSSFPTLLASSVKATNESSTSRNSSPQPPSFLFPEPSRPTSGAAQQHASVSRHQSTGLVLGAIACALALVFLIGWFYLTCWQRYRVPHSLSGEVSFQHQPAVTHRRGSSLRSFCINQIFRRRRLPGPAQIGNDNDSLYVQSQPSLLPPKIKKRSSSSSPYEKQWNPNCCSGLRRSYQQLSDGAVVVVRGSSSFEPCQEGSMTPSSAYSHCILPSSSPQCPLHPDASVVTPPSPKGSTSRASVGTTSGLSILSHCSIRSDCHHHLPYCSILPRIQPQNQKQLQQQSCQPCLPEAQARYSFAPTRTRVSSQWLAELRPAEICKPQSREMAPCKRLASQVQQPIEGRKLSFLRKATEDISQPRVVGSKFSETSQRLQQTANSTSSSHEIACTTELEDLEMKFQKGQQRPSQVNVDCSLSQTRDRDRVARLSKLMRPTNEAVDIATVTFGTVQESEMWLAGSHSSCGDYACQLAGVFEEDVEPQTYVPKQDADGKNAYGCSDGANYHDDNFDHDSVQIQPSRCAPQRKAFLGDLLGDSRGFRFDKADEARSSLVQEEQSRSEPCPSLMHDRCSHFRTVDSESFAQLGDSNQKTNLDRVTVIQIHRVEQQQQQQKSSTSSLSDASLFRAATRDDRPERAHFVDQVPRDICGVGAAKFLTNESTYDQRTTCQGPSVTSPCVYTSQPSEREQQQDWLSKPPSNISVHCGAASCMALAPGHRISNSDISEREKLESYSPSLVRSAALSHARPSLRTSIEISSTSSAEPSFRNRNIRSVKVEHKYRPEGQESGGEGSGSLTSVDRGSLERESFVVETRQRYMATVATRSEAISCGPTLSGFIVESRPKISRPATGPEDIDILHP